MKKPLRAVTYCCIHKIQPNIDKQESELVAHAQELNLAIVANYLDNTPAYKLEGRLQLNELIKAAIRKEFDCVLIYKFTSLAASVPHLLNVLKQLIPLNIRIISLHDQMDTQGQMGQDIIAALQTIIKLKEALIRERTIEGLQRARSKGKKLGRPTTPPPPPNIVRLIEELAATTSLSIKKIREETGKLLSYQVTRDIIHRVRKHR